jgi:hypothetical protein
MGIAQTGMAKKIGNGKNVSNGKNKDMSFRRACGEEKSFNPAL